MSRGLSIKIQLLQEGEGLNNNKPVKANMFSLNFSLFMSDGA